jgi:hypothetical protein
VELNLAVLALFGGVYNANIKRSRVSVKAEGTWPQAWPATLGCFGGNPVSLAAQMY